MLQVKPASAPHVRVVLSGDHWHFECDHCGASADVLKLCGLGELGAFVSAFDKLHRRCRARGPRPGAKLPACPEPTGAIGTSSSKSTSGKASEPS